MATIFPPAASAIRWPAAVWHVVSMFLAAVGIVLGIGLVAAIVVWGVLSLLWPGQMSKRGAYPATRPQTVWLFIGLAGLGSVHQWVLSDQQLAALSFCIPLMALPVLVLASISLLHHWHANAPENP